MNANLWSWIRELVDCPVLPVFWTLGWRRKKTEQEVLGVAVSGGGVRRDLAAVLLIKHQINGIGIELMSHKS